MKKGLSFLIKILVGVIIGVSCYFIASACKSPVKIADTDAKYMSRLVEAPKDGSLPTEHNAIDVIAYTLWSAANTDHKIKTTGVTKAAFATQKIDIDRVIKDKKAMVSTVSTGFITVAGQKFYANNKVFLRKFSKVDGDNVTWSNDAPECISYDEMIRKSGWLPFQANGYIISPDTLLNKEEIKVEKADNDLYKITFDLNPEPDYAPFWYRREIVDDTNSSIEPIFKSIHVEFKIDKDYRLIYQTIKEVYVIQTYGLKAETTTTIEDYFTYDNVEFDKDYLAFFNQYENVEAKEDTKEEEKIIKEDAISMVMSSLQNGVNDVLFDVDAKIDKLSINGNASLNIFDLNNIKFKLKLEDLVDLEYLNSNVYVSGYGFKLQGSTDDIKEVVKKFNNKASKGLNVNELINQLNGAKIVENGNNRQIETKLDLYGIPLEISINIDRIDNGYVLNYIKINTNILKRDISLNIKKGNTTISDKDYSDYQSLKDLMPIINRAIDYLDKKNFDFDFETSIYNSAKELINIKGNLKFKLHENNEFDVDLNIILKQDGKDNQTINIKLISDEYYKKNNIDSKGMVFINYGFEKSSDDQLRIKLPLKDCYSLLNTVIKVLGLNLNIFDQYSTFNFKDIDLYQIRNLINLDLSNITEIKIKDLIKEFTIKDNILNAKIDLKNNELITIKLDANKYNNILTKLSVDNLLLKKTENDFTKLNLKLNSLDTNQVEIKPDDKEYVLINNIDELINGFIATSTLKDFNIKGDVNLDLSIMGSTFKNIIGVDLKTIVDENKKPIIHLNLDLDKLDATFKYFVTTSKLDIYYKDNYVYLKKISKSDTYELKVEKDKFLKDIKHYVVEFGLGVPKAILEAFSQTSSSSDAKFELNKIINGYSYENNKFNIKLDMASLLKNKNYEILDLTLVLNEYIAKENESKVKMLSGIENLKFSIMKLVNININELKLVNVTDDKIQKVDMTELTNYITNNNNEVDIIYKNGVKQE